MRVYRALTLTLWPAHHSSRRRPCAFHRPPPAVMFRCANCRTGVSFQGSNRVPGLEQDVVLFRERASACRHVEVVVVELGGDGARPEG